MRPQWIGLALTGCAAVTACTEAQAQIPHPLATCGATITPDRHGGLRATIHVEREITVPGFPLGKFCGDELPANAIAELGRAIDGFVSDSVRADQDFRSCAAGTPSQATIARSSVVLGSAHLGYSDAVECIRDPNVARASTCAPSITSAQLAFLNAEAPTDCDARLGILRAFTIENLSVERAHGALAHSFGSPPDRTAAGYILTGRELTEGPNIRRGIVTIHVTLTYRITEPAPDGGTDAGSPDSGPDAGKRDAGPPDSGPDAGKRDAGPPDSGGGGGGGGGGGNGGSRGGGSGGGCGCVPCKLPDCDIDLRSHAPGAGVILPIARATTFAGDILGYAEYDLTFDIRCLIHLQLHLPLAAIVGGEGFGIGGGLRTRWRLHHDALRWGFDAQGFYVPGGHAIVLAGPTFGVRWPKLWLDLRLNAIATGGGVGPTGMLTFHER